MGEFGSIQDRAWMEEQVRKLKERTHSRPEVVKQRRVARVPGTQIIEETWVEVPISSLPTVEKCKYCDNKGYISYPYRVLRGDGTLIERPKMARCVCPIGMNKPLWIASYVKVYNELPPELNALQPITPKAPIDAEYRVVEPPQPITPRLPAADSITEGVVAWDMTGEDDAEDF